MAHEDAESLLEVRDFEQTAVLFIFELPVYWKQEPATLPPTPSGTRWLAVVFLKPIPYNLLHELLKPLLIHMSV